MTRNLIQKTICALIIPLTLWGGYLSIVHWKDDDALYQLILSIFVLIVAVGNLLPNAAFESKTPEVIEESIEEVVAQRSPDIEHPEKKATIMITRNHTDEGLYMLESLLKKDKRVLTTGQDEGRYYSVPDGRDLPEWFSLHIGCKVKHLKELLVDLPVLISENIDKEDASKFQVRRID
jgi:hypothetical protein